MNGGGGVGGGVGVRGCGEGRPSARRVAAASLTDAVSCALTRPSAPSCLNIFSACSRFCRGPLSAAAIDLAYSIFWASEAPGFSGTPNLCRERTWGLPKLRSGGSGGRGGGGVGDLGRSARHCFSTRPSRADLALITSRSAGNRVRCACLLYSRLVAGGPTRGATGRISCACATHAAHLQTRARPASSRAISPRVAVSCIVACPSGADDRRWYAEVRSVRVQAASRAWRAPLPSRRNETNARNRSRAARANTSAT